MWKVEGWKYWCDEFEQLNGRFETRDEAEVYADECRRIGWSGVRVRLWDTASLQPPPKIELGSANTNPNPAPKGPPPVSQTRPAPRMAPYTPNADHGAVGFHNPTGGDWVWAAREGREVVIDKHGVVRLTPEQAREFARHMLRLADQAQSET